MSNQKTSYLLPKKPGDPIRVVRVFEVEGLKRRRVRLNPGSEGRFIKMEEVGMPSIGLIDQMGLGAYDTPRFIANFPEGPVYLEESDFQFKYVERPMDEKNLFRGVPGATPEEQQARRQEIQNLHRIEQRYARGDDNMSLFAAIQRIASQHPETRKHLVPVLRKYAEEGKVACTCPAGIGHNAADYLGEDDEVMGGRTWGVGGKDTPVKGQGNPSAPADDRDPPYNKHPDSPPAGCNKDGGPEGCKGTYAQRLKYNEWFRNNVCPKGHKTNCGAPWLKSKSKE